MLTYPAAVHKPLGPQTEPRMTGHDIVCLHTMAGYLSSTDRYFRAANGAGYIGTESHFGVGGRWGGDARAGLDGTVWQWQPLTHQADANLHGNPTTISIETADNAARPIQPWTPKQLDALAHLLAWLSLPATHADCPASWECHTDGIPLTLIPDTLPHRRGVGYHRQGCPPNIVPGGVAWSTAYGKDCPTQARIDQIPAIITRAQAITAAKHTPPPQEDDPMAMTPEDRTALAQEIGKEVAAALLTSSIGDSAPDAPANLGWGLYRIQSELRRLRALVESAIPKPPAR